MGWWISLVGPGGDPVEVPRHGEGGTAAVHGVPRAELSVTYNYSDHIRDATGWPDSLRSLDGRKAGDTIDELRAAVRLLGTDQSLDYWEATPGNAGHALSVLLDWAQQRPDATWRVS